MKFTKCIALSMGVFLMQSCNHLFYHPDSIEYLTPDKVGLKYEAQTVRSGSEDPETLSVWKIPAIGKSLGKILHFHGNAQNMTAHFMFVGWLAGHGFDVYVFDYRGYGASSGETTREGLYQDALAMIRHVQAQDEKDLFIIGQSLGGAVAVPAVADLQPAQLRALVLDSSFSSYREMAQEKLGELWLTWPLQWPLSFLVSDAYSPRDYAGKIKCPVLVIQGVDDHIISYKAGEALFACFSAASKKFWRIEAPGHTPALLEESPWRERLVEYLCSHLSKHKCTKSRP